MTDDYLNVSTRQTMISIGNDVMIKRRGRERDRERVKERVRHTWVVKRVFFSTQQG